MDDEKAYPMPDGVYCLLVREGEPIVLTLSGGCLSALHGLNYQRGKAGLPLLTLSALVEHCVAFVYGVMDLPAPERDRIIQAVIATADDGGRCPHGNDPQTCVICRHG